MDLIGPYTLKGKDGTQIDFMRVTMIDPATSWFEIVELPVYSQVSLIFPRVHRGARARSHINRKRNLTLIEHQPQ